MVNLKQLDKRRGGGNFSGGETETIAVMLMSVETKDPKKAKATPGEDVGHGFLLGDALGLTASFDDKDRPQTAVKFTRNPSKQPSNSEHAPLDVFDLMKRRGMHLPIKAGGTVVIERAYVDNKTGLIKGGHLKAAVREPDLGLEACHPGLPVMVEKERYDDRDGEKYFYQHRLIANTPEARAFNSIGEFRSAAEELLEPNANVGGTPGVYVRIVNTSPDENGEYELASERITLGWNRDESRRMTPAETLDRWMADEENADWVANIEQAGEAGYVFEVVPFVRFTTGKESLPSKRKQGLAWDHEHFEIDVLGEDGQPIVRNDGAGKVKTSGFAVGIMMVRRMEATDDAMWFATDTFRQKRFGPIFLPQELVTDNLPKEVKEHFEAKATARGEARRAENEANRPQRNAAPAAGRGQDFGNDEVPFGEPDHGGGLTPS